MSTTEEQIAPRRGIRVTYIGHPPAAHGDQTVPGATASFWRAGLEFRLGEPRLLPLADLTTQQLNILRDHELVQGRLIVEEIDDVDFPPRYQKP